MVDKTFLKTYVDNAYEENADYQMPSYDMMVTKVIQVLEATRKVEFDMSTLFERGSLNMIAFGKALGFDTDVLAENMLEDRSFESESEYFATKHAILIAMLVYEKYRSMLDMHVIASRAEGFERKRIIDTGMREIYNSGTEPRGAHYDA